MKIYIIITLIAGLDYEAQRISNVNIVKFLNPLLLSRLRLIYADCLFSERRESALRPSRATALTFLNAGEAWIDPIGDG